MPNPKRVVGKPSQYRSSVRSISSARERTRFQTLATLNIKPLSREDLVVWRSKIFAIFLLVLLAVGLYEFFMDEWFFVERVEVQGLNILTQREVERATGVLGYNTFFLEPSQIERAVGAMPEIKSAHVMLGIPNSMLIEIEERVPETIWFKGDEAFWVDADGLAFKARSPRTDLPTVRDFDPTGLQAGKRVTPPAFNAFRAVRAAWQSAPKSFEWTASNGLAAIDEHGWKIIFGDASDMDLKIAKLKALMARLVAQGTRVKFIDLGKGEPFYQ
jgi:cell division septal protein FtsQ